MKRDFIPSSAIFIGFIMIIWAINLSGDVKNFVSIDGLIITIFGSLAALTISFPFKVLKNIPNTLKMILLSPEEDRYELTLRFVELAKKTRKDGLLSLEDEIGKISNDFLKTGLQLIVDGADPDVIERVIRLKMDTMERRHSEGQQVFSKWGEIAPAFGMIGTLIGLITMLARLEDPSAIGVGMATALLTTFYGALLANLVFLPIASNLREHTDNEIFTASMILDGLLEIQSGTNPRMIEEKLINYIPPKQQKAEQDKKKQGEMREVPVHD